MASSRNGDFKDKIVWITGAGTGIGRATAQMFAREGATVALMGRRENVLQEVLAVVKSAGGRGEAVALDVSDRAAVDAVAKGLLKRHGRIDILINNAGLNIPKRKLVDLEPAGWDTVINVNLTGAYNVIQAVLPPMRKDGGGLIVNVSSMAAKQASGLSGAAYTASKHGMNGLSHAINAEEWRHGIRATAVCPGEVNTDILDKRPVPVSPEDRERLIHPDDMADTIRFLAAMHPRTNITEMMVMPTYKRQHSAKELG